MPADSQGLAQGVGPRRVGIFLGFRIWKKLGRRHRANGWSCRTNANKLKLRLRLNNQPAMNKTVVAKPQLHDDICHHRNLRPAWGVAPVPEGGRNCCAPCRLPLRLSRLVTCDLPTVNSSSEP